MELDVLKTVEWMEQTNEKMQAKKDELTTLDQPIGDGDHGINMARGFQEVVNKLNDTEYNEVSAVLKDVAMTLMSKVGGASGPLYGTAFLKISTAVKGAGTVERDLFAKALTEAVNGIKQRGKATEGEKTMIDMWSPISEAFQQASDFRPEDMMEAAQAALESVKELEATKGRAAYFKEKSVGHLDPGAVSTFYLFEALADVWKGDN
ncbi:MULTISPECIES: dihydroxyacetone kinase subunit DhaL [Virgibacillus]|uniref:phosphoenolpyruvate--glycerone phosphotransferase n=2 Tax=Virgibacillus TaxID=84406 RepID=A0A024Q8R3_9BACI|nr:MULTISPECIES: dihydroxyacetone kinase subunit DhaL [Virgibacillus]EQB37592.1 hypothetical protein M948_03315 [Virgibacillus sp. CM-4]MYL40335.1 dihydroxyacetone kinase subunit L [Virgibacillus massiliensis]GGJ59783.1 dihydroxyacetone kinase subunit L [Virgibacillus kapii]CDQ38879.1 PTS-dependent dihydroxyacetone kinase, ADP-binding subunit DhaL [Virgibacillus massiliensis]